MGEVSKDDEAFLRAILNGHASVQPSSKGESVKSDAALLAALLKDEGIGPYTPPNQLREQLLSAVSSHIILHVYPFQVVTYLTNTM